MSKIFSFTLLLILLTPLATHTSQSQTSRFEKFDVVVVGATPAGISAAVNAARSGATVALTEETTRIGGLLSGGMSQSDFKSLESVQGTFREFMNRVKQHYEREYGANSKQVQDSFHGSMYEPKVALAVFEKMIAEQPKIRLFLQHRFDSAVTTDGEKGRKQIRTARFIKLPAKESLEISGKVFIDATYEGDLMAAAGSKYIIGRESRAKYGELFAGVIYMERTAKGRVFLHGSSGAGDNKHVQCYNFRVCMTDRPENRVPISKPANYRREEFLPLLKLIQSGEVKAVSEGIVRFREIPNGKVDVNDRMHAPISLRLMGENDEWPEGGPEVRARIYDRFRSYSLSLFYFLQNDAELPESIRAEAGKWGLPKDEFEETGHFSSALYVREGRRLVGDFVFTEHDTQATATSVRTPVYKDSVAVGDYPIDCHGDRPPVGFHPNVTDGSFAYGSAPFQVPYRVMLPANVDGLLVPVAVSASHIGFSALRMEPTWVALGQAAGLAASQAIQRSVAVRDVDVYGLQQRLHEAGAITIYFSDVFPDSPYFKAAQHFGTRGYFHDVVDKNKAIDFGRKGTRGQHLEAYPYHKAELNKPIDKALAQRWISMLADTGAKTRATSDAKLQANGKLTRGEFLQHLHQYDSRP